MRTRRKAQAWSGLVAAVALAVTLTGCGAQSSSGKPGSSPASAKGSSTTPGAAPATSLAAAVLTKEEAPPGTTYLAKQSGAQSLDDVLHSGIDASTYQDQLRQAGFEGAYRSMFVGSPAAAAAESSQRSVGSFALSFPSAAAAAEARTRLDAEISTSGTDVRRLPDPGLASEDTALQSRLDALHGSTFYYSWVQGPVVRILIDAGGDKATDDATSLTLARKVAKSPSSGSAETAPVASLVIPRTDPPRGTAYAASQSGPRKATSFGSPTIAQALRKLSMRSAYATLFLSPAFQKPASGTPAAQTNVVSSESQKYRSAADASRAYHLFVDRERKLFQGHPVGSVDSNGLGSEGYGFSYVDKKPTGDVVGIGYYWRAGDLVLSLTVVGSPAFATEKTARGLADTVDGRLH